MYIYIHLYIYIHIHILTAQPGVPQIMDFGKMMTGLLSMAMFGFNVRFVGCMMCMYINILGSSRYVKTYVF